MNDLRVGVTTGLGKYFTRWRDYAGASKEVVSLSATSFFTGAI
jgi:hypothetical protein